MKKLLSLLSFCAVCNIAGMEYTRFDESKLKQNAVQFGNKTANLMELQNITNELNIHVGKQKRFIVPDFLGIKHNEVIDYLNHVVIVLPDTIQKKALEYINEQWKDFTTHQPQNSTVLCPAAKISLQKIRNTVLNAFNPENKNLFFLKGERKDSLDKFLKDSANQKLMVRSTGREDSKDFANAGGNESIAAVPPTLEGITKAMGEVVASYFSEKSMGQRLTGAPDKVFEQPFMPVLLQVMVGEEEDKIPTSGVMFSQEAEGPTPGVAAIQATYGHNEGVVNGFVPVDTFYIGPTKTIHPLIRIKNERLRPGQSFSLERTPNPIKLQQIPCLDKQDLLDLKTCADFIESYYGYPVDIEFVKLGYTINLVQVRPIVQQSIKPSFVKNKFIKETPRELKLPATVIGAGGSAVRIIRSKDNIIMSDNIRQALDIFINTPEKDSISAIIVGELAPATSHEATNFRGAGKPVVYFPDINKIRALVANSAQTPLLIDIQREQVITYKPTKEFTNPEDEIEQGWLTHPISKKTSLFGQFRTTPTSKEDSIEPKVMLKNMKIPQLLDTLKDGTNEQSILAALKTILYHIQTIVSQEIKKSSDTTYKNQLKHIFAQAITCAVEIYKTVPQWTKSKQTSSDRVEWLYPQTFLQAIINQIPLPKEFVANYSLLALIKIERQEQQIKKTLGLKPSKVSRYIIQYAKAEKYALTDTLAKNFEKYLQGFSSIKDPKILQEFAKMIYDLQLLDIIPIWLNLSYAATWQIDQNPEPVTKKLLKEYTESKEFLDELHNKKQQIDAIVISNWQAPEKFKKMLSSFKEILDYFTSDSFINKYENSQILAKNTALGIMNQLVTTFDLSIKTLEPGTLYSDKKLLAKNFATMLENYFALLNKWRSIQSIQKSLNQMLEGTYKTNEKFKTLDEYYTGISTILTQLPKDSPSQLQSSPQFNVSAASLGSKASWERSIGNNPTLDDIFTLIHQNLLVVLATLSKQAGLEKINLPPIVAQLNNELEKISVAMGIETKYLSLIGVTLDNKDLIHYYNLPLQHHSNTFQIQYDINTKETIFETKFLGPTLDHGGRWEKLASLIPLVSKLGQLHLKQPPQVDVNRGLLIFSWNIKSEDQAKLSIKCLKAFLSLVSLGAGPSTLEQLSSLLAPRNQQQFFDEFIKNILQYPDLILFLPGIILAKQNNFTDETTVKRTFDLLPEVASNAQTQFIKYIDDMMTILLAQSYFAKDLVPEKIFETCLRLIPQVELSTLANIFFRISSTISKIKDTDFLIKSALQLLHHKNINEKLAGLKILSSLAFGNRALPEALTSAFTFINDDNKLLADAAIGIILNLANHHIKYTPEQISQVTSTVIKRINDPSAHIRSDILKIIEGLVKQNKFIDEALNIIHIYPTSDLSYDMPDLISLISTLFELEIHLSENHKQNIINKLVKLTHQKTAAISYISTMLRKLLNLEKHLPIAFEIIHKMLKKNPQILMGNESCLLTPFGPLLQKNLYSTDIEQIINILEEESKSCGIENKEFAHLRNQLDEMKKKK